MCANKRDKKITINQSQLESLQKDRNAFVKAELSINLLGIETRYNCGENFRSIYDILKDVVTLLNNNPTIIDDAIEAKIDLDNLDEVLKFFRKYDLKDITVLEP